MRKNSEQGRSLVELIAVIVLIALLAIAVYKIFASVMDSAHAQTLEQEINTRVTQLRHQALTNKGISVETLETALSRLSKASTGLPIQTLAVDKANGVFTLRVGYSEAPLDYGVCQEMMKSLSFSPANEDACQKDQVFADFKFPMFNELKKFANAEGKSGGNSSGGGNGGSGGNNSSGGNGGSSAGGPGADSSDCGANASQRYGRCVCDSGWTNWQSGAGCLTKDICGSHGVYYDGDLDVAYEEAASRWGLAVSGCACDKGYKSLVSFTVEREGDYDYVYATFTNHCNVSGNTCDGHGRLLLVDELEGVYSLSSCDKGDSACIQSTKDNLAIGMCVCDSGYGHPYEESYGDRPDRCVKCSDLHRTYTGHSTCGSCENGYDEWEGECYPVCTSWSENVCGAGKFCNHSCQKSLGICLNTTESNGSFTDSYGTTWRTFPKTPRANWGAAGYCWSQSAESVTSFCLSKGLYPSTKRRLGCSGNSDCIVSKNGLVADATGGLNSLGATGYFNNYGTWYDNIICMVGPDKSCQTNNDCTNNNEFCLNPHQNWYEGYGRCVELGSNETVTWNGRTYIISSESKFSSAKSVQEWCSKQGYSTVSLSDFPVNLSNMTYNSSAFGGKGAYNCEDAACGISNMSSFYQNFSGGMRLGDYNLSLGHYYNGGYEIYYYKTQSSIYAICKVN